MVTVVVWPAPTPFVAFITSFMTTGDAPTALVWVKVVEPVVVMPLFHLIVPVLGVGLAFDESDLMSVLQFAAFKVDVELLVPLVIPATPLQPVKLAESLTVEFTFLEAVGPVIGGNAGHGLGDSLYEAVIFVAGKPLISACLRMMSSSFAR